AVAGEAAPGDVGALHDDLARPQGVAIEADVDVIDLQRRPVAERDLDAAHGDAVEVDDVEARDGDRRAGEALEAGLGHALNERVAPAREGGDGPGRAREDDGDADGDATPGKPAAPPGLRGAAVRHVRLRRGHGRRNGGIEYP